MIEGDACEITIGDGPLSRYGERQDSLSSLAPSLPPLPTNAPLSIVALRYP